MISIQRCQVCGKRTQDAVIVGGGSRCRDHAPKPKEAEIPEEPEEAEVEE